MTQKNKHAEEFKVNLDKAKVDYAFIEGCTGSSYFNNLYHKL